MGYSNYVQRDEALRNLIQPLAGEYGMHNGEPQGEVVRYTSCVGAYTANLPRHRQSRRDLTCLQAELTPGPSCRYRCPLFQMEHY